MHYSNKNNKISLKEIDELCDPWYDFDYDDYCGPGCPCCAYPPTAHDDFFYTIAETVANIIVAEQKLNPEVKQILIDERMESYTAWPRRETKMNDKVREDIAFIWPRIKNTKAGFELFSQIFGQQE